VKYRKTFPASPATRAAVGHGAKAPGTWHCVRSSIVSGDGGGAGGTRFRSESRSLLTRTEACSSPPAHQLCGRGWPGPREGEAASHTRWTARNG
jgi:hypothetical protein